MAHLQPLYALLRYLMLGVTVIIMISGLVTVIFGLWMKYGTTSFVAALDSYSMQLFTESYIYMGTGSTVILIGAIGFCGALKENRWLILLFFFIVTSMFIAEVVGVILVLVYSDKVRKLDEITSKQSLLKDYMGSSAFDPISEAWNVIMLKYKCCGFYNKTQDFQNSWFSSTTGLKYPKTCCIDMNSSTCNGVNISESLIHPEGCFIKLAKQFQNQSVMIGSIASAICVIEVGMRTFTSHCVCVTVSQPLFRPLLIPDLLLQIEALIS
uniref:Tetraspanin n=1 Tax=Scleropages formosus TaxID=113540 RepID=A0A8C9RKM2_SCLFO